MPDPRELFELALTDHTADPLDANVLTVRGRRAIRRRRAAWATPVVVAIVASAGVASVLAARNDGRRAVGASSPAGFAFASPAQVDAADARVHAAMVAFAGTAAGVTSVPVPPTSKDGVVVTVRNQIAYQVHGGRLTLTEAVSRPDGKTGATGSAQQSPCPTSVPAPQTYADGSSVSFGSAVECVASTLSNGFVLWTYRQDMGPAFGTGAPLMPPQALIVAPDGSSLRVQSNGESPDEQLKPEIALSTNKIAELAETLMNSWQQQT